MSENYQSSDNGSLFEQFDALAGNWAREIFDTIPMPIEVFTPDGLCIFANREFLRAHRYVHVDKHIGVYNFNDDAECKAILGQDVYDRVSRGETVEFPDFPAPIDEVEKRGVFDEKPYEAATWDLLFEPTWKDGVFIYTTMFFTLKKMYHGKPEIVKARKYIDEHWLDDFDEAAVAKAANVSPRYLRQMFQNDTGATMLDYYKSVKVDHLKEKLEDKNLNIAEAFSFCSVDSRGKFGRIFRELTGMTPREYKDSLKKG